MAGLAGPPTTALKAKTIFHQGTKVMGSWRVYYFCK